MKYACHQLIRHRFGTAAMTVEMRNLTTWKVGGSALAVSVTSQQMLSDLLGLLSETGTGWFVIGRGSNLLASDDGCREVLIRLEGVFHRHEWNREGSEWVLSCGGGSRLPSLAGAACTRGAAGLEFAVGIPGTTGGAIYMNAGAYGTSMSDLVCKVETVSCDGSIRQLSRSQCSFGYRSSGFQDGSCVISMVKLRLATGPAESLRTQARSILQLRREKFPLDRPSAGSVFKRPENGPPPGKLIEDCELKGRTIGGAMVSPLHANFILNMGGATSDDMAGLIDTVRIEVLNRTGIELVEEIEYLGFGRQG